jgi:tRNA(fMet)-specific endonuclease VapC
MYGRNAPGQRQGAILIYLLDTNHCSYLIAGNPAAHARLKELGPDYISTCSIVRGELIFMANRSARRIANLKKVEWLLSNIIVMDIDSAVADAYGELKAALFDHFGPKDKKKQRKTTLDNLGIGENDL